MANLKAVGWATFIMTVAAIVARAAPPPPPPPPQRRQRPRWRFRDQPARPPVRSTAHEG
jgi:hypothetical protein